MPDIDAIISTLNHEISQADRNVGVAVGLDLFFELKRRGLTTSEVFSAYGSNAFPMDLPAINRTHAIFVNPLFDNWDFHVGGRERINA